ATEIGEAEKSLASNRTRHESFVASNQKLAESENQLRLELADLGQRLTATREEAVELRSQVAVWKQKQTRAHEQCLDSTAKALAEREAVEQLQTNQQRLRRDAEATDGALNAAHQAIDSLQRELDQVRHRIASTASELSGARQRADVIEELERRWDGINAGAKDILLNSRNATHGPLAAVVGLTADLIRVQVQHAPLVDAALGTIAQYLVVANDEFVEAMERGEIKITGRVGVISLEQPTSLGAHWQLDPPDHPDIVGPLDGLVQCDPAHELFFKKLLHGTWIVKSLSIARRLRASVCDQVRYVTLDGELVEVDGVVVAGPKAAAMGLVSRRSELRALHRQCEQLQSQIDEWKQSEATLSRELVAGQTQARELLQKNQTLAGELARLQAECQAAEQRLQMWDSQSAAYKAEWTEATQGHDQSHAALEQTERAATSTAEQIAAGEKRLMDWSAEIQQTARQQAELETEIATIGLKVDHLREQQQSADRRRRELSTQLEEVVALQTTLSQQLIADREASQQSELAIHAAVENIGSLEHRRDELTAQIEQWQATFAQAEQNRRQVAEQLEAQRQSLQDVVHQRRENRMRSESLQSERNQLRQRLWEDYQIDVTAEMTEADPRLTEARQEVDQEINELRHKVQALGSINMDALAELQDLESRYLSLDQQYQDLVAAKESLTRIIHRINGDSRRLFTETLDAIRANFQKLFRLTFGGGQADLVLEDNVDILDAGVEIIATPPGKPKFNNSLLSGGEKALTAVSLLMSIFQYRPSPFCVLDEVDAPFDEANIGRFIDVLKSFLGWTKFVIVTHSKKTMTAATTLYGVTMQESGVSKRVSVRFEDVSDDGQISEEAIKRTEDQESTGSRNTNDNADSTRSAVA
ncbi:MAG TPA: hypothetical protein PKD54_09835, partial [Pirellulaceae bacterium]|nr:hypothetical protein [Pirellulaceae bacterium]